MVEYIEEAERSEVGIAPVEGRRTPWHLWAVGGLSVAWNLIGVTDYTMSQLRNEAWLDAGAEGMGISTEQMITYIDAFPAWLHAFWALGVWGAIIGSVLLLMRSRHAVWAFGLSLLGLAVTQFYRVLTPQPEWMSENLALNLTLWSVATFLLIYAISMRSKGVIR